MTKTSRKKGRKKKHKQKRSRKCSFRKKNTRKKLVQSGGQQNDIADAISKIDPLYNYQIELITQIWEGLQNKEDLQAETDNWKQYRDNPLGFTKHKQSKWSEVDEGLLVWIINNVDKQKYIKRAENELEYSAGLEK